MSMGSLSDSDEDDFNPEINTTPLVDVMLVLLIIFIITIPVLNHNIKIDLPHASSKVDKVKPENIQLAIDADGQLFWDKELLDQSELQARIASAALKEPQPELHLRAERLTPYEKIAQVMSAAQSGGLTKIGFVTEPGKH
ncbi:ExbD/TolR family protein [Solimicrobium silvestre]|uniref:Biopolymer transport protein n=1 Tax=Solimicrobium silvestre TaxID=2099400 RepID=A0A2S9H0Z4_9BURK|nr:biopolymer transporter ExbD [Solimicrobium silvestre]PRC93623.1 Biopolymer transport protein [Solimicrobium silvestre]